MAILVVCRNCMSRFSVSEKFAGRKGPCPKCKELIEIPKADEQVQVHAPEHSEAAARGATGELVLKPVAREKTDVPIAVWVGVGIAAAVLLLFAVVCRFMDSVPTAMLWIAAIGLAPPCAAGSYFFLRDEELGGYTGKELWIRSSIAGMVHALCWLAFSYLRPVEIYEWFYMLPPLIAIGGAASYFALDLDFFSGVMNFCFYLVVTVLLAMVAGISLLGDGGTEPEIDPRLQMRLEQHSTDPWSRANVLGEAIGANDRRFGMAG